MPITLAQLKNKLVGLFGEDNDTSNTVDGLVARLAERVVVWRWPEQRASATPGAATARNVDTGSKSLSQPWAAVPCFGATRRCKVKEIRFSQAVSSTVTNTISTGWTLLVAKRGNGIAAGATSTTNSYSLTTFIAGLTTDAGKYTTGTGSYSVIAYNIAGAPNLCHLNSTKSKLQMEAGDMLQVRVKKGGSANDGGASFKGGTLIMVFEDN